MLESGYFKKVRILLGKLTKYTFLDAYRIFDAKLCVGHRNKLGNAKYHAPHRSGKSNTKAGADLEEFRSLSERLKSTNNKENVYIEQENTHSLSISCQSPQIAEYYNVYYHPDYRCLFTEEGCRIESSFASSWIKTTPVKIEPPEKCKVIDKPFLYIGAFETYHYGHFIVEGISQLWALAENNGLPVFYANWMNALKKVFLRREKSYIDELMSYMPLSRDNLYYSDQLIKFTKIRIPQPTSVFGVKILNHHRLVPEYIAQKVIERNGGLNPPRYDTIYLSRSKLKDGFRSITNESELEERLRAKGVEIVYPETLTLSQQIMLFNSCKNIIGVQGSALHNILFVIRADVNVYTICSKKTWLGTFQMIDEIKESQLTNTYIYTLDSDSSDESEEWRQDKIIDVEATMAELSKSGLFD